MKSLRLPAAMIGLTALLTACPQTPTPTPPTAPARLGLTVNLTGVSSAPVKVTNTSTNTVLNDGPLSSGKTFGDLTAGTVLKVEPGNISDFTAPATQTITLDASKTITLEYKALAGSAVQSNRIQGTLSGLPAGGTQAMIYDHYTGYDTNNVGTVLGNTLNLPLTKAPDVRALSPLLPSPSYNSCVFTGTQTAVPNVALFASVEVLSAKNDLLGEVTEQIISGGTLTDSSVARIYSDSAATVKGTVQCSFYDGSSLKVIMDLTLRAGWNAVEYVASEAGATYKTLSSDARSALKGVPYEQQVFVTLDRSVDITSDASVTVPAMLYQIGGYSGQVSLSTDVPGLTVEPSSLSLSPLSAQNVKDQAVSKYLTRLGVNPQRLDTNLTFKYSGQANLSGSFNVLVKDAAGVQVGGGSGMLNITRPGLSLSACYPSDLGLYPNTTGAITVCANTIGSFSGPVTFSATNLPEGVTVTPVTQQVSGYSYSSLSFKADASAKPGSYPITLTADGGAVTASTTATLKVLAPTVNVNVSGYYGGPTVYQGGTAALKVDVSTDNGFNGTTTLNVTGLPAGVSAAPRTVTVTPGSTTSTSITLTAAADAVLGDSTIKVTSPDQSAYSYGQETTLSVRPARLSLGTSISNPVKATGGIWAVTEGVYDSSLSSYKYTVTRFTGTAQAAASASVASGYYSPQLISTTGGVVVFPQDAGKAPTLIADDGTMTQLPPVAFSSTPTMTNRTDSQGRVWFVQTTSTSAGTTTSLKTWTPETGVIVTMDSTANYGYSSYDSSLILSNDGKTLIYLGGYSGDALKIDTGSGTITKLDLVKSSNTSSAAVAGDGTLWFSSGGLLARLNADNSVTRFNNVTTGSLIGFDLADPTILWGADYSSVYKISTVTPTSTRITMGSITKAVLNDQGGAQVITSEYGGSSSASYLSLIK
ncbi:hypothetical protein LAJ19_05525 [Deinococcus taeanensis]|uniref:hypothetical protein n=1 Tax=Deinococcus taeanensis TaxID=2737050 RepID=UPI001CDB7D38|nr:hypothetical protein [Deinococcus taeanensis]UBV43675.1 hypothetical protein LAJ19_05525 [Deinococcus taeanensis]